MNIRVLANPKAGCGAARARALRVVKALERVGAGAEMVETRGSDDAARLVREAHADRVECVAIVGGDGTLNEVRLISAFWSSRASTAHACVARLPTS
jgi:diacylglycerol kinase family enzyme